MQRMCCLFAKVGLALTLGLFDLLIIPATTRADLYNKDASQSFPDLSGDIVGTQSYHYNPGTGTGTFRVQSAPGILATGPTLASESYVYDPPGQPRSQSLEFKLDSSGRLIEGDPGNSYSLYGSVTVNGKILSGLLLKGTPDRFGWLPPTDKSGTMSVYDLHMNLTDGLLKPSYGKDAYVRIVAETNSTFDGTFTRSFDARKAETNVRSYNKGISPSAIPEPSTFAIVLTCGGAWMLHRRLRRLSSAGIDAEEDELSGG
ncbi:MAG: hypothetical protein NVSMB9_23010 [Isosphaeraceae bacterium]